MAKVQVTRQDQQDINAFSNLYARQGELELLLKEQKKVVDDLDDACAEIMLADDDEAVCMKVGDCFWAADKDAAEAQLEELSEAAKQEHRRLEGQLQDVNSQIAELRSKLYARLGDSINLEA